MPYRSAQRRHIGRREGLPHPDPMKYTHALLSIGAPGRLVIMGGIGLPGGAVFIERGRIRGAGAQPDLGGGPADERAVRRRVHGRRSGWTRWTAYRPASGSALAFLRCSR
ncbi:hypothetical protein GCM10023238_26660 [Streptomyces heliomycini]